MQIIYISKSHSSRILFVGRLSGELRQANAPPPGTVGIYRARHHVQKWDDRGTTGSFWCAICYKLQQDCVQCTTVCPINCIWNDKNWQSPVGSGKQNFRVGSAEEIRVENQIRPSPANGRWRREQELVMLRIIGCTNCRGRRIELKFKLFNSAVYLHPDCSLRPLCATVQQCNWT